MAYVAQEWMTTTNTSQTAYGPVFTKQAQTFLASKDYTLRAVSLRMGCDEVPKTVNIHIAATLGNGEPSTVLSSTTVNVLVLTPLVLTYFIDLSTPVSLTEGVLYAIIIEATDTAVVEIEANNLGAYSQGANWGYSTVVGWTLNDGRDLFFETLIINNPPTVSTHPVSGNMTGDNGMITIRRIVAAANNKIWYET